MKEETLTFHVHQGARGRDRHRRMICIASADVLEITQRCRVIVVGCHGYSSGNVAWLPLDDEIIRSQRFPPKCDYNEPPAGIALAR